MTSYINISIRILTDREESPVTTNMVLDLQQESNQLAFSCCTTTH